MSKTSICESGRHGDNLFCGVLNCDCICHTEEYQQIKDETKEEE